MTIGAEPILCRRDLLKRAMCGGALLSLGHLSQPLPLVGAWQRPVTKPIPSTGEALAVVGLGTGSSFSRAAREPSQHERLEATLGRFVELGGDLVDTAPIYGQAEPVLGALLRKNGLRESVFFATKVAQVRGAQEGMRQAQSSAQHAAPGPVDLLQVHNLVDWRTQVPLLLELKAEGRVRYVGVSTYLDEQYDELATILRSHPLDFVQVDYAINNRGAEEQILGLAADRGAAVIANMPFGNGRLFEAVRGRDQPAWLDGFGATTWAQFFLRWIISHPHVTCAIPATANPEHVEDNLRAAYGSLPSETERQEMSLEFRKWLDA